MRCCTVKIKNKNIDKGCNKIYIHTHTYVILIYVFCIESLNIFIEGPKCPVLGKHPGVNLIVDGTQHKFNVTHIYLCITYLSVYIKFTFVYHQH